MRKCFLGVCARTASTGIAALAVPLVGGLLFISQLRSQSPPTRSTPLPSFEVVSIRLHKSGSPVTGMHFYGDRFNATTSAGALVHRAYSLAGHQLLPDQISGDEGWVRSDNYDIDAKVNDSLVEGPWKNLTPDQKRDQVGLMIRSMLINRFHLQIRQVTQVRPVYELVVAKNGPKFKEDHSHPGGFAVHGRGFELKSAKLNPFVSLLSLFAGRPVLDKTALTGTYTFTFDWRPEPPRATSASGNLPVSGAPPESSAPSLFTALQEQLGLKLVPTKALIDVIVIDHIERPTEN